MDSVIGKIFELKDELSRLSGDVREPLIEIKVSSRAYLLIHMQIMEKYSLYEDDRFIKNRLGNEFHLMGIRVTR